MSFNVRKAKSHDGEYIGTIIYKAWQQSYIGLINKDFLDSMSIEKSINKFKTRTKDGILICEVDGKPVGVCAYLKSRDNDLPNDFGEIQAIYLLDGYKRKGYGSKLICAAEDELRKMGFRRVNLWVLKENTKAISFYKKQGYNPDGKENEDIIITPTKEIRMIKNL